MLFLCFNCFILHHCYVVHYLACAFPLDWIDLLFMETSLLQEARSSTFSAMDAIIFKRYGGMISYHAVFIFDIGNLLSLPCLPDMPKLLVVRYGYLPLDCISRRISFLDLGFNWLVGPVCGWRRKVYWSRFTCRGTCAFGLFSKQNFFIRSNSILWPNLSNLTSTGHFLYYSTWHKHNNEAFYILPSN